MKIKFILPVLLVFSLLTEYYFTISLLLFLVLLGRFISNIGKKLLFIESISLYSVLLYLIIPKVGYTYYSASNPLSRLWVTYMKVPEITYFEFALPAILLFIWALFIFEKRNEIKIIREILAAAQNKLADMTVTPYLLIFGGLMAFYIKPHAPGSLQYVLNIAFLSSFAGMAYLFFARRIDTKGKLVLGGFAFWLFYQALLSGMFTIIVYMGISFFGLLMLKTNYSYLKKCLGLLMISVLLIILQFAKTNYRLLVKRDLLGGGSKLAVFVKVFKNNLTHVQEIFNLNTFFPIYLRANQGYHLAAVMYHIPAFKPHDNGNLLGKSIVASVVPRALWPGKPEAGGKKNMKYYANIFLDTTSMNVGPIGEGYGAFGKWGGIFYMFLFGSFLSLAYRYFIRLAVKKPLLLFWQPLIFYEVIFCMENDTMQALNSLIKISVFLFVLFKLFPGLVNPRKNLASPDQLVYG